MRRAERELNRVVLLAATVLAGWPPAQGSAEADACVLRAELDGVVQNAVAEYLARAVHSAEAGPCQAVLVVIDTPGGSLDATRSIAKTLLEADLPVLTFVHPSGARAGSAGMFVSAAGHIAAMAPGTNIGAAHPVSVTGQSPEQSGGEHLAEKIEKDTAAFARAIGEKRGRNRDWLQKAVTESASATAREAKTLNVIDRISGSVPALLDALDGTVLVIAGQEVRLHTADAQVEPFAPTIQERALSVLSHPNVAYALLMIGMLGLMVEAFNPGLLIPGGVGLLSLLLGAIGMNMLPVHAGAVALLVAGLALLVAELYVTSFGLLTLGGAATLVLGSALLIDRTRPEFFAEPSVDVSWGLVIPLVVVMALLAGIFARQAARLRQREPRTGGEALVHEQGEALSDIGPDSGWVQIHGERWRAVSRQTVPRGTHVRVVERRGLTLRVEPAPAEASPASQA